MVMNLVAYDCQRIKRQMDYGLLRACEVVLDYFVPACMENLGNWFYGNVSHCFHLGSRILKCPFLLYWLPFRYYGRSSGYYFRLDFRYHFRLHFWILLPAALPVLLPAALPGTTSGSSPGYFFLLHFWHYIRFRFWVLLQSEKGIAMHSLCETSCPPRTVHLERWWQGKVSFWAQLCDWNRSQSSIKLTWLPTAIFVGNVRWGRTIFVGNVRWRPGWYWHLILA